MQTVLNAKYYQQRKKELKQQAKKYHPELRYAFLTGAYSSIIDFSLLDMKVLENRIEELENQIEKLEQEKELARERESED